MEQISKTTKDSCLLREHKLQSKSVKGNSKYANHSRSQKILLEWKQKVCPVSPPLIILFFSDDFLDGGPVQFAQNAAGAVRKSV